MSPVVVRFVDTQSSAQAGCAKPGLQSTHNRDYNRRITGTTIDGGPGRERGGGPGRAGAGAGAGAGGLSGPDPVLHPDQGRMLLLKNRDYNRHCIDQLKIACCGLQPGVGVVPT